MDPQNNIVPYDVLLIIFSYLLIDDLVTVQRVYRLWRFAAQDKSLWKNYKYKINYRLHSFRPECDTDIRIMPAVRNIGGYARNTFLKVILENIIEISILNVMFEPPLTSSQIQSVLKQYPKLKVICLCLRASDILESMQILKTSRYIEKLNFNYSSQFSGDDCLPSKMTSIFNVFTESSSFVALKEIDLVYSPLESAFKDKVFSNILADIIKMRSHQLLSLHLSLFHPENANILNSVSKCKKLTDLVLGLHDNHLTDVNIVGMSALKTLHLWLQNSDYPCTLSDYFNRGCWSYLTQVCFTVKLENGFSGGVLRAIIENVKKLKTLYYEDFSRSTDETELDQICTLLNLVNLSVKYLKNISEKGISYVLKCTNIINLDLEAHISHIDNHEDYVRNELKKFVKLEMFRFIVPNQINIYLRNMREVKRFTSQIVVYS